MMGNTTILVGLVTHAIHLKQTKMMLSTKIGERNLSQVANENFLNGHTILFSVCTSITNYPTKTSGHGKRNINNKTKI
jgi:hypothetical protein|tara:strand:- start:293 stop:526 length:234 start_codon:yes stop_codon:yes gene_type:complete